MSETVRLYKYRTLLSGNRCVSKERLISEVEVSEATFKRDIAKLRDQFEVPIVFDRDRGGYVIVESGEMRELPGVWFSQQELLALATWGVAGCLVHRLYWYCCCAVSCNHVIANT